MSSAGDWVPVLVSREDTARVTVSARLRDLGFTLSEGSTWVQRGLSVQYLPAVPSRGLPFDEQTPSPPVLAGWFVVRRADDQDARLARELAETLAEAAETFVAGEDGRSFTLRDGNEATTFGQAIASTESAADLEVEEDGDDTRAMINWATLASTEATGVVVVYRADAPFTAGDLGKALRPLAADVDVTGAEAEDLHWSVLRASPSSLDWAVALDRGRPSDKLPFYVRARFDHGERARGEEVLSAGEFTRIVRAARAFDDSAAPAIRLTAIDCEVVRS